MPPDHIVNNWTDELLNLMITYLNKRKSREEASLPPGPGEPQMATDAQLFSQLGDKIKVVKHGN